MRRVLPAGTLLLLIIGLMSPSVMAAAPPLQGGNRLQNGDFEGGFSERGAGEVVVAAGWEPWWEQGTQDQDANGFLKRPEYKPDSSRAGGTQQKFFNNYATHNAGIYQRVAVPRGSRLTLTARVYVWSSEEDSYGASNGPGNYEVHVGIDPTGGTNALAGSVVWGPSQMQYDRWVDLRVETTAQADAVTVFLRGTVQYRVKNNNSYWDDVVLTAVATQPTPRPPTNTPQATATPQPTATPQDTPTPEPTSTPVDTPVPTDTPTPTVTATPTSTLTPTASPTPEVGSLCVVAYEDADENGRWDPQERLLAAREIRLLDGDGTVLGEYVTDGESEPYCFEDLSPGTYQLVKEALIDGGTSSTQATVVSGESVTVAFGDRVPPTPTPEPTVTVTSQSGSSILGAGDSIYRMSGILVLVLAAGIAVGYTLLQRQR